MPTQLKRRTAALGLGLAALLLAGASRAEDAQDGAPAVDRARRLSELFLAAGGQGVLEERLNALLAQEATQATSQRERVLARLQPDPVQAARFADATAAHLERLRSQGLPTLPLSAGQLKDAEAISDADLDALLAFYRSPAWQRAAHWLAVTGPGMNDALDRQFALSAEQSRRDYGRRLRQLSSECACPR